MTEQQKRSVTFLTLAILAVLALTWGSSFILIKKSLLAFEWHQVAALRMGITMLFFLPVIPIHVKKIKSRKTYWHIFLMALFGNAIPGFLYPIAQTQIDSSLAGLINSSTPLFVLVTGVLIWNLRPNRNKYLGVIFGFIGVTLLIYYGQEHKENTNIWYALFAIGATFCYGISANVIKEFLQNIKPITSSAIAFLLIGPPAWIYLFTTDFFEVMSTDENAWISLASVSTLAIMGTAIATLLFVRLLQLTNAVFGSMVSYIIPIVAVGFGFLDGETITIWHGLGIALILFGVYQARK
jgi:drug/metabolite transporter (DMT)-like permease